MAKRKTVPTSPAAGAGGGTAPARRKAAPPRSSGAPGAPVDISTVTPPDVPVAHAADRAAPQPQGDGADRPTPEPATAGAGPTYDQIAEAAYLRYLRRGGTHGSDFDDWVEAERELRSRTR